MTFSRLITYRQLAAARNLSLTPITKEELRFFIHSTPLLGHAAMSQANFFFQIISSFFLSLCVWEGVWYYPCVEVCRWVSPPVQVYVGAIWSHPQSVSCLWLESGSLLEPFRLGWLQMSLMILLSLVSPVLGLLCTSITSFSCGCWRSKLKSSCLDSKHLTHWTIPLVPILLLITWNLYNI